MKYKINILLRIVLAALFLIVLFKISFLDQIKKDGDSEKNNRNVNITQIDIPILIYHYVEYNQDKRDFIRDSLNVQPHVFEKQITTLKNAGYTFITPKDIPGLFNDEKTLSNKYVILSFDDGYEDFYTDVMPILKRQNVKAINYVIYNSLGRPNYMNESQLKEVVDTGLVEIGSHTLSHPRLTSMKEEIVKNEILLSKQSIEKEYGVSVLSFSYPYGAYNESIIEVVKESGYSNAVSDDKGIIVNRDNLFYLKRLRPGYLTGQALLDHLKNAGNQ